MEKFFKPVHSPSGPDEIKPRKHHHHYQDPKPHRDTAFDDTDRNTDESHGHHRHHHHGRYFNNTPHLNDHRHHQKHHSEEDEILYEHETPVTVSRASSSSLSSSSSSSFSSWYTEESANDPFSLRHAEQPHHSLSCSNIADVRRGFREDDGSEPIVFATIKHDKNGSVCSEISEGAQKRGKCGFASLDRGHSRSNEGLVQGNQSDARGEQSGTPHINYRPLYKAASLNRSLAFGEEDFLLGVSKGPKRAVSSSQLPSKGILKNKEPHADIRKAKSMEVLSPRVFKGQVPTGQKGNGINIEQARANFVQGKLQFSAFLDEITKQVISPSALTILGVSSDKTSGKTPAPAQTPGPVKPQLPPKKHRESSVEEREQRQRQHNRQEKAARKHSDCSNHDKLVSYAVRNHHGSPPPRHSHSRGSNRKVRRPSPTGSSVSGDRYGRCGPHFTDGTSTSPEPSQPKKPHHSKQEPTASHSQHRQHFPQQVHPGPGLRGPMGSPPSNQGVGSESSHSSEHSSRQQPQHVGQCRDTLSDADLLQALQEENTDLHQNLLQTVVCIESLEVELQRTKDELSHVKEKYQSLLETHSGTKQANNLLGEHLHIASESLTCERKYLLNRVSQLSSELEDAHRTIAALENINVPCLIKELLEKHFNSAEAIQKFVTTAAPVSHPATTPQAEGQSQVPKVEEASRDWLKSEAGPQRVTAFLPFKHLVATPGSEGSLSGQHESSTSFSVSDISTAICKRMAASYAARPQPVHPQSQQHADNHPNLQQAHVGSDSWDDGKSGVKVMLLEPDVVDATPNSVSAQQILDDFLQQLQPYKEAGKEQEQQGGQEW